MSDLLACLFRLLVKKMDWIGLLKGKRKRTTVQGMFVCVCVCVCVCERVVGSYAGMFV